MADGGYFACTILAQILRSIAGGAAVLIGVVITMLTGTLSTPEALGWWKVIGLW